MNHQPKLYISRPLPPPCMERLQEIFNLDLRDNPQPPSREDLFRGLPGADAAIVQLTDPIERDLIETAARHPNHPLKMVAQVAVGLDNIDHSALVEQDILLSHTPGVLTQATADLAMALLLASSRRIVEGDRFVRNGSWSHWSLDLMTGLELQGAKLGIIGLGRIGQATAHRARAFGMQILYTGPTREPASVETGLDARYLSLDELLNESDVVSIHAPLLPETKHLLNRERLFAMKPGAILINTARGPLVEESALADALENGPLRAAGLDVFENEPQVHESLLVRQDVVLLPHIGSATKSTRLRMASMATESVIAWAKGEPVPHLAPSPQT